MYRKTRLKGASIRSASFVTSASLAMTSSIHIVVKGMKSVLSASGMMFGISSKSLLFY